MSNSNSLTVRQRKDYVSLYSEAHNAITDIADSLLALSEMLDSRTGEQLALSASGRQGLAKMMRVFHNALWDGGLDNLPTPSLFARLCGVEPDKEANE